VTFLCAKFQVKIRNSTFSHVLLGTTAIFLRLTDDKMISREKQIRILISVTISQNNRGTHDAHSFHSREFCSGKILTVNDVVTLG
jgi:hypothetical protein